MHLNNMPVPPRECPPVRESVPALSRSLCWYAKLQNLDQDSHRAPHPWDLIASGLSMIKEMVYHSNAIAQPILDPYYVIKAHAG
jgi:hypothetical protein